MRMLGLSPCAVRSIFPSFILTRIETAVTTLVELGNTVLCSCSISSGRRGARFGGNQWLDLRPRLLDRVLDLDDASFGAGDAAYRER